MEGSTYAMLASQGGVRLVISKDEQVVLGDSHKQQILSAVDVARCRMDPNDTLLGGNDPADVLCELALSMLALGMAIAGSPSEAA